MYPFFHPPSHEPASQPASQPSIYCIYHIYPVAILIREFGYVAFV